MMDYVEAQPKTRENKLYSMNDSVIELQRAIPRSLGGPLVGCLALRDTDIDPTFNVKYTLPNIEIALRC